jgi:hypothetical protein
MNILRKVNYESSPGNRSKYTKKPSKSAKLIPKKHRTETSDKDISERMKPKLNILSKASKKTQIAKGSK